MWHIVKIPFSPLGNFGTYDASRSIIFDSKATVKIISYTI
jgi:hypothetical protein